MTFDDVRAMVLAWPGVEESTSYGTPSLKVKGKFLTRLKEDGDSLVIKGVSFDEREMLMEAEPEVFYITDHYRGWPTVLMRLSKARPETVKALLLRHWKEVAPKKLVKTRRGELLKTHLVDPVTPEVFRRAALDLPEAEESAHQGHPDFRVRGKIFATLGWPDASWGVVKLTPEEQELLCQTEPEIFTPVPGGWGRRGWTNLRLAAADETTMRSALAMAWRNVARKSLALQCGRTKYTNRLC